MSLKGDQLEILLSVNESEQYCSMTTYYLYQNTCAGYWYLNEGNQYSYKIIFMTGENPVS